MIPKTNKQINGADQTDKQKQYISVVALKTNKASILLQDIQFLSVCDSSRTIQSVSLLASPDSGT